MAGVIGGKLGNSIESASDGGKKWASRTLHEGMEFAKQGADKAISKIGEAIENDAASGVVIAGARFIPGIGPAVSATMGVLKVGYNYALKGAKTYKSADPYLDGSLHAAAIVNCGGDVKKEKVRRRKEREKLIADGKASPDKKHQEAAERLERDMVGVERARLSKHVYDQYDPDHQPPTSPPTGYLLPSSEELVKLKFKTDELAPGDSSFRAQIYKVDPEVGPMPPEYIMAFRGTVTKEDWLETNGPQGLGRETKSYNRAMELARKMARTELFVEFTGHSLGGGLASAAAVITDRRAFTQNSAGLHANTTARQGKVLDREKAKSLVNAYRIDDAEKDEMLSSINKLPLMPDAVGTVRSLDAPKTGVSRLGMHSVDTVIDSIENQKTTDQQTLRKI